MTKLIVGTLAAVGAVFLVTALAQSPRPTQQLVVYDGRGKRVGIVSGGGENPLRPLVPFQIDGVPFMLYVSRDGFSQDEVVWQSADCTGTPYVWVAGPGYTYKPSSTPAVAVGPPGNTVYVESGSPVTMTFHSYSIGAPGDSPCSSYGALSVIHQAAPARALVDMNTFYTPPFTVR
jgi:hypothetical protein